MCIERLHGTNSRSKRDGAADAESGLGWLTSGAGRRRVVVSALDLMIRIVASRKGLRTCPNTPEWLFSTSTKHFRT